MIRPLDGIRVIEWSQWQAAPVAGEMLGDLGAEVIKIEHPAGGDGARGMQSIARGPTISSLAGRNYYFEAHNRSKKSITLDLQKSEAREVLYQLVGKSDVFLHNLRPDIPRKLSLDYDTMCRYNPKLVYAASSGFGPKGPERDAPAFDYIGLARSAMMLNMTLPDAEPCYIPGALPDQLVGTMLAFGVVIALLARDRLGIGQYLDVSQIGANMWLQSLIVSRFLATGQEYPMRKRTDAANPLWNHYKCADGRWIVLALLQSDKYWHDFCEVMGLQELEADPKFANIDRREENSLGLINLIDRAFATQPGEYWAVKFREKGFVFGLANRTSDLPNDPQVIANDYIVNIDHPNYGPTRYVGFPISLDRTPAVPQSAPPELGQHTEEVLSELLGYDWDRIVSLRESSVI